MDNVRAMAVSDWEHEKNTPCRGLELSFTDRIMGKVKQLLGAQSEPARLGFPKTSALGQVSLEMERGERDRPLAQMPLSSVQGEGSHEAILVAPTSQRRSSSPLPSSAPANAALAFIGGAISDDCEAE